MTLKSALSKAKHEFDLAAEMVQLIEQGTVQTFKVLSDMLVTEIGNETS